MPYLKRYGIDTSMDSGRGFEAISHLSRSAELDVRFVIDLYPEFDTPGIWKVR